MGAEVEPRATPDAPVLWSPDASSSGHHQPLEHGRTYRLKRYPVHAKFMSVSRWGYRFCAHTSKVLVVIRVSLASMVGPQQTDAALRCERN
eukprot:4678466-Pyramimonas_sp.AAC.3